MTTAGIQEAEEHTVGKEQPLPAVVAQQQSLMLHHKRLAFTHLPFLLWHDPAQLFFGIEAIRSVNLSSRDFPLLPFLINILIFH